MSDPVDPAHAKHFAQALGLDASIPYKQAMSSDVLVMAMPWSELEDVLSQLGPLSRDVVVDAAVPDGNDKTPSGAESLAHKLDRQHVVEAFVETKFEPGSTIAICSDDPEARALIADIIRECGCTPPDLGAAVERRPDGTERRGLAFRR